MLSLRPYIVEKDEAKKKILSMELSAVVAGYGLMEYALYLYVSVKQKGFRNISTAVWYRRSHISLPIGGTLILLCINKLIRLSIEQSI